MRAGNKRIMLSRRTSLPAAAVAAIALTITGAAQAGVSPRSAQLDLNAMRAVSGLSAVHKFKGGWNRACRLHNRYMRATGEFGHSERRSSPYYSRSGARAAGTSVIARPSLLPSVAWGDTVYHRLAMLQPRLRSAGYDGSSGYACMQVLTGVSNARAARAGGPRLYPWPADGSTGHAPVFAGYESPDPLADAPGASQLGTPITVSVNGPWTYWQLVRSQVTAAALLSDSGASVPVSASDMNSPNGAFLQGGFALMPRQALAPFTWYTFSASGRLHYRGRTWDFSIASRFQTGADGDSW